MDAKPTRSALASTFECEIRAVMERVRCAVSNVVVPLLGTGDVRASVLESKLEVDSRLAWKFARILTLTDSLGAVRFVPGPRGVKLFLRAATKCRAPRPAIDRARAAFEAFDQVVRAEAGTRRAFDMMVGGFAGEHRRAAQLEHRRAAVEHNSFIWGVIARLQIYTYIIAPSADGRHVDLGVIRGFVDLRRIRPHVLWRISHFFSVDDRGRIHGTFAREPLDPAPGGDVPLLRAFCSQPLPDVSRVVGRDSVVNYYLSGTDVGNTPAVTCLTGEVVRRAEPRYPNERHAQLVTKIMLRTPCEAVLSDVILHRGCFGRVNPMPELLSDLFADSVAANYSHSDELPHQERVEFLGSAGQIPPVEEMPRYAEMVDFAFGRLGWRASDFDAYRLRAAYPPIPASFQIRF